MPHLLVAVQNLTDLVVEKRVPLFQALGQVLVDGGFGDAEFLRCTAHGGTGFNHVRGHNGNKDENSKWNEWCDKAAVAARLALEAN